MGGAIIGQAAQGAAMGATEPLVKEGGKTARYIIEKDPDVAVVPLKMAGYSGGAFVALIFILLMVGVLWLAFKLFF